MIKFVILCGILGLTSFVGFEMSKTYKEKLAFYDEFLLFCKTLKNEISFMKTDIITVIKREQYKSCLAQILSEYSQQIKNDANDKKKTNEILARQKNLNEKDKELLSSFLFNLGKLSFDEQISSIEYYIKTFEDLSKKQSESNSKMVPFCNKMGILVGLVICIVLI